jgi:hypothetical protein
MAKTLIPIIPRKVAEAIEWLRNHQRYTNYDIIQRLMVREFTNGHHAECIRDFIVLEDDGFDTLLAAIINGYGVADEESVAQYYHDTVRKSNEASIDTPERPYYNGMWRGIQETLNKLGIKLEGVNV